MKKMDEQERAEYEAEGKKERKACEEYGATVDRRTSVHTWTKLEKT